MHGAVHGGLLSGSTGSLLGTGRVVHPYVHALDHALCKGDVISGDKDNLAYEAGILGNIYNLLDEVLTRAVGRVGLAGKQELDGHRGIVYNLVQTVKVAEQQSRPLVGGKTAGKAYGEHIVTQGLEDGHKL